jgi:hypothetical protein
MLFVGPPIFGFSPLIFPRKDQLRLILLLQVLKPLRLMKIRTEMKPKDLWRRDSTTSPPPAISEDRDLEKKRKREGDVASSSTSVLKEASGETASAKDSEPDMFELLDS